MWNKCSSPGLAHNEGLLHCAVFPTPLLQAYHFPASETERLFNALSSLAAVAERAAAAYAHWDSSQWCCLVCLHGSPQNTLLSRACCKEPILRCSSLTYLPWQQLLQCAICTSKHPGAPVCFHAFSGGGSTGLHIMYLCGATQVQNRQKSPWSVKGMLCQRLGSGD